MEYEWRHGDYIISIEKTMLDLEMILPLLTTSAWAKDLSLERVKRAVDSLKACLSTNTSASGSGSTPLATIALIVYSTRPPQISSKGFAMILQKQKITPKNT